MSPPDSSLLKNSLVISQRGPYGLQQAHQRSGLPRAQSQRPCHAHFIAEHIEAQNSGRAQPGSATAKYHMRANSSWDLREAGREAGRMHGTARDYKVPYFMKIKNNFKNSAFEKSLNILENFKLLPSVASYQETNPFWA